MRKKSKDRKQKELRKVLFMVTEVERFSKENCIEQILIKKKE